MTKFTDGIGNYSKVIFVDAKDKNEISVGDTGEVVVAAWGRANVLVRWDKDNKLRSVRRKRLKLIT